MAQPAGAVQSIDGNKTVNHLAAQLLMDARRAEQLLSALPDFCRPRDLESALLIQNQVTERLEAEGELIGAWKCASPAPERIIAAPVYHSVIYSGSDSASVPVTNILGSEIKIEPEVALLLGKDLPPRATPYTVAEVDNAIVETRLAFEIIGSRYMDPAKVSFPELLADGLLNSGLVLGPKLTVDFRALPETMELGLSIENLPDQTMHGVHPERNCMRPLYWLVNFLNERGVTLKAGQAIITGSYAGVLSVPVNCVIQFRLGSYGTLTTIFQTKNKEF